MKMSLHFCFIFFLWSKLKLWWVINLSYSILTLSIFLSFSFSSFLLIYIFILAFHFPSFSLTFCLQHFFFSFLFCWTKSILKWEMIPLTIEKRMEFLLKNCEIFFARYQIKDENWQTLSTKNNIFRDIERVSPLFWKRITVIRILPEFWKFSMLAVPTTFEFNIRFSWEFIRSFHFSWFFCAS